MSPQSLLLSTPVEHPGEAVRQELEKRGWSQAELARIINRPVTAINETVTGKRGMTPEMAVALGVAFGTGPQVWMQRDSDYRLSLVDLSTSEMEHRARLFQSVPIKEMEKRQWINKGDSAEQLERELCRFYNVDNLEQPPKIHAHARSSFSAGDLNPAQVAWCVRAAKLASVLDAEKYKSTEFPDAIKEIRQLADFPEKAKHIPRVLAKAGVRLVVVEPLSHTRIDGAAFWLADDAPVIVLSARFDRLDSVWFTLAHEMSHIHHEDAQSIDSDLFGEDRADSTEQIEKRADEEAADLLIPHDKLRSFIVRIKPFYSKVRIIQFAHRMKVHPAIVVGQLQMSGEIGWNANREMLSKVREHLTKTALTDGWGSVVPVL